MLRDFIRELTPVQKLIGSIGIAVSISLAYYGLSDPLGTHYDKVCSLREDDRAMVLFEKDNGKKLKDLGRCIINYEK